MFRRDFTSRRGDRLWPGDDPAVAETCRPDGEPVGLILTLRLEMFCILHQLDGRPTYAEMGQYQPARGRRTPWERTTRRRRPKDANVAISNGARDIWITGRDHRVNL